MMFSPRGFILVTTLVFMLVLSCLSVSMVLQTQLSQKLAGSATATFQLKQQTQTRHMLQLQQLQQSEAGAGIFIRAACPAQYAAWSNSSLSCEWHQLKTTERSGSLQHSMTSFLVRQAVPAGGWDEVL
jgi:Tfp pilus assembly protein PilX